MDSVVDMTKQIETFLLPKTLSVLRKAGAIASANDMRLLMVGGIVRDTFLNCPYSDVDLLVGPLTEEHRDWTDSSEPFDDLANKLASALINQLGGSILKRSQFGTIALMLEEQPIEIACARRELYNAPGALPTVRAAGIEEDLHRRDFTINSMAIELNPPVFGKLLDPLSGVTDLNNGLLRPLHPRSFQDDPTRILRGIRYQTRLALKMTESCARWMRRDSKYLNAVTGDRIRNELARIINEPSLNQTMLRAQRLGTLKKISNSLNWPTNLKRIMPKTDLMSTNMNLEFFLIVLTNAMAQSEIDHFKERLHLPKKWNSIIDDNIRITENISVIARRHILSRDLYDTLAGIDQKVLRTRQLVIGDKTASKNIGKYLDRLMNIRPLLNPNQLERLGVPRGPMMGRVLSMLLGKRLDNEDLSQDEEEVIVKRYLERA